MDLPNRKPTHLRGYDYTANGAYFVTICTHDKKCIFGGAGSPAHAAIEKWILALADKYANVRVDKYVVMPNHIHVILMMENMQLEGANVSLHEMVKWLKTQTTNEYIKGVRRGAFAPFDKHVWQRGYYEHVIRTPKAYEEIWQYIHTNPLKWEEDCYHMPSD